MRSLRLLACLLALATAVASCTDSTPSATRDESPSPSASTPAPPPPPPMAPLTGLRTSASVLRRPALAIKIDNHTDARPQVAIDQADLVYEEPVEGGITRFIAVFHSQTPPKVGPVRSARLTDLDVLAEYGRPILAYSGAAGYVLDAIRRSHLVSMPHGANGSLYRRDSSRWVAPHNLFTTTSGLWRRAARRRPTPARPLFTFGALPAPPPAPPPSPTGTATPAPALVSWPAGGRVIVPFGGAYTADWRWDGRAKRYLRWSGGRRHGLVGGRQVHATNVLVMRVKMTRSNRQAARRGSPQLAMTGSGQAFLLRNGVRIEGRWIRNSLDTPTTFVDKYGRPMVFAPGNTWIELVPTRIRPLFR